MMEIYRVLIELKRIQTYLFAVPKLRTILGANALVGEALRIKLPELAIQSGQCLTLEPPIIFGTANGDPLSVQQADSLPSLAIDDPTSLYRQGVLSRDGGHFQAIFKEREAAERFCAQAESWFAEEVEGLAYEARIEQWAPESKDSSLSDCWKKINHQSKTPRSRADPLDPNAAAEPCQWSGQGKGTEPIRSENAMVSRPVWQQWSKGSAFREGLTLDIVGLMQKASGSNGRFILPCQETSSWQEARDLNAFAGGKGRYLALIHVDGNSVGVRRPRTGDHNATASAADEFHRWLSSEAEVERFFHDMRTTVRAALVESLQEIFGSVSPTDTGNVAPYQLLMIGGDDVLILMQARFALPWVAAYAKSLDGRPLLDGKGPLTVGAGVAIAKSGYPFHALHRLAEDLASSAKRLARSSCDKPPPSVVDWQVVSQSRALDIETHRRQHDCIRYSTGAGRETLILTMRPYAILPATGSPSQPPQDLRSLLDAAETIRMQREKVARSQRKSLADKLRLGLESARLAIANLPTDMLKLLDDTGACPKSDPWIPLGKLGEDAVFGTVLGDLNEIAEVPDLGRAILRPAANSTGEAA